MAPKNDRMANRYGLSPADFADHGGGFPVTVVGVGVVGSIVVRAATAGRSYANRSGTL